MNIAGLSVAGPRPVNEDSFFFMDFSEVKSFSGGVSAFIMVSDGMGGHEGGDVASQLAVKMAEHYIQQLIEMGSTNQVELDVAFALKEIVNNANEAILQEIATRDNSGMGATFVGAFLGYRKAWVAHVGDSRAYLIHKGEATQLTRDHSAVGRMLSEGLITEKEAQDHPQRNVIERALGFTRDDPEIVEVPLARGDALLLCSDGVSTVLNSPTLARCVLQAASIEDATENVVSAALKSDTDDNSTVVIAAPNWNTLKANAPKENSLKRLLSEFGAKVNQGKRSPWILVVVLALCCAVILGVWIAASSSGGGGGVVGGDGTPNPSTTQTVPPATATTDPTTVPDDPKAGLAPETKYVLAKDNVELRYLDSEGSDGRAWNFAPDRVYLKLSTGDAISVLRGLENHKVGASDDSGRYYYILAVDLDGLSTILEEEDIQKVRNNEKGTDTIALFVVGEDDLELVG